MATAVESKVEARRKMGVVVFMLVGCVSKFV
jgi:hypothetical protein